MIGLAIAFFLTKVIYAAAVVTVDITLIAAIRLRSA